MRIPARAEVRLPGTMKPKGAMVFHNLRDLEFEPNMKTMIRYDIAMATAVVRLWDDTIPVQVLNTSPEEVKLYKGTWLGKVFLMASDIIATIQEQGDDGVDFEEGHIDHWAMPEGSKPTDTVQRQKLTEEQIDLSASPLTESQKKALLQLFKAYHWAFSVNSADIGHTDVVQHTIDTGDHPPIRQRPYWVPAAVWETFEQQLPHMQEQGVVKRSASAWTSPILFVGKKE